MSVSTPKILDDKNILSSLDSIPFPTQIDKEPLNVEENLNPNVMQLKDVLDIHQQNMQNYQKGNICELVYSEQKYNSDDKKISYNKLLEIIHTQEIIDKDDYKKYIYKNFNEENELYFSSHFESGNLFYAIKHNPNEYDLILRPETGCQRVYQWFFFLVKLNTSSKNFEKLKTNPIIKFNIINLCKKTVLFSEKVKVLAYYNNNWTRDTFNVHYYLNGIPYQNENSQLNNINNNNNNNNNDNNNNNICNINGSNEQNNIIEDKKTDNENNNGYKYHTLTFSIDLSKINGNEKYIYFSYCYPFTYTQLDKYLTSLNSYKDILRFGEVGKSLDGNILHMLIITNFKDSFDDLANKKAVIFTARIHPGESNGSYVIQGVIDFLLSNDPSAKNLRNNFIFKIIPMLNPDGVRRGNFRMNVLGKDLNRMWVEASVETCPTVYYSEQMILKTLDSRDIYFFCDFHGHSTKYNFFLYSCKSTNEFLQLDEETLIPNPQKNGLTFYELVFQNIFNKENKFLDIFSCVNKINPSKLKTSRALLKLKYNIDFSYGLETSIGGMKTRDGKVIPFTISQYRKVGKDFCVSLNKLTDPKIFFSVLSTIRFSKHERGSLYSKSKNKAKEVILPSMNNIINNNSNLNNNNNVINNGNNNVNNKNEDNTKHNKQNITKEGSFVNKDNHIINNNSNNKNIKKKGSANNKSSNTNIVAGGRQARKSFEMNKHPEKKVINNNKFNK